MLFQGPFRQDAATRMRRCLRKYVMSSNGAQTLGYAYIGLAHRTPTRVLPSKTHDLGGEVLPRTHDETAESQKPTHKQTTTTKTDLELANCTSSRIAGRIVSDRPIRATHWHQPFKPFPNMAHSTHPSHPQRTAEDTNRNPPHIVIRCRSLTTVSDCPATRLGLPIGPSRIASKL